MGKWDAYTERYGEDRSDFVEAEEEDVERCAYCNSRDNIIRRRFKVFKQTKTELICSDCLAEELEYENESRESVQDAQSKRVA